MSVVKVSPRTERAIRLLAAVVTVMALSITVLGCRPALQPSQTATPTLTPTPMPTATEPILPAPPTVVPSEIPAPAAATFPAVPSTQPAVSPTSGLSPAPAASALPTPMAADTPASPASLAPAGLYTARQRLGVCGSASAEQVAARLGFGWYLDWSVRTGNYRSTSVEYLPMIRLYAGKPLPGGEELRGAVAALPGALWLIGNEPDVKWQDNVTPDAYAQAYYSLYTLLKSLDPSCRVAIGGVSQPTPLRLRYLDLILDAYKARYGETMPVDVWNVHNFVLREERDSWGVDIPPGMTESTGVLREIVDHDNIAIFRQQIVDFRAWMKERGLQEKPLIVTEYGVLMPGDYGFPEERVEQFMLDTFRYFDSAVDRDLGMPADGYRLVQRWCWFSLADDRYPTGNLLSPEGALTPLGEAFAQYAHENR